MVGAGVALAALVAALVSISVALVRAIDAERGLRAERDRLEAVTRFQQSMLGDIDLDLMGSALVGELRHSVEESLEHSGVPRERWGESLAQFDNLFEGFNPSDLALRVLDDQMLERALRAIERDYADRPVVQAALRQTVAETYRRYDLPTKALDQTRIAFALRSEHLGENHPDTLWSMTALGLSLFAVGKTEEAERVYRDAHARQHGALGENHRDTLTTQTNLGLLLMRTGRPNEAERLLTDAATGLREHVSPDDAHTVAAINALGVLHDEQGRPEQAVGHYREAWEITKRTLGDRDYRTHLMGSNLGEALRRVGSLGEAELALQESWGGLRRLLGDDHPHTLDAAADVARLFAQTGRGEEGERIAGAALTRSKETGRDLVIVADLMIARGASLTAMRRFDDAEEMLIDAEALLAPALGDGAPLVQSARRALVELYLSWERAEHGTGHRERAETWRDRLD